MILLCPGITRNAPTNALASVNDVLPNHWSVRGEPSRFEGKAPNQMLTEHTCNWRSSLAKTQWYAKASFHYIASTERAISAEKVATTMLSVKEVDCPHRRHRITSWPFSVHRSIWTWHCIWLGEQDPWCRQLTWGMLCNDYGTNELSQLTSQHAPSPTRRSEAQNKKPCIANETMHTIINKAVNNSWSEQERNA